MKNTAPLKILILTDGKMGDLAQCRGVASAFKAQSEQAVDRRLQHGVEIAEAQIAQSTLTKIPYARVPVSREDDYLYDLPLPDLIIASGRRTVPHLRNFKRKGGKNPPFIAFLKDPRHGEKYIDWMWVPAHDTPTDAAHVYSTALSPHGLNDDVLSQARATARKRFDAFTPPFTGIILGGNSKSVTWDAESIAHFSELLSPLPSEGSILVTASRRTPDALSEAVKRVLGSRSHWFWDNAGENPYTQMLAVSNRLIVTGDSHNMVSEACASPASVHIFRPPGLSQKLTRFLDALEADGHIVDLSKGFSEAIEEQTRAPLNQTDQIAQALLEYWSQTSPKTVHPRWG